MVCHVVPPMRFAEEACETLEAAVLAGFPVQIISAGQAGATSPATIAGSLVQAVAETLAGLVFVRLVDPQAAPSSRPSRWWRTCAPARCAAAAASRRC